MLPWTIIYKPVSQLWTYTYHIYHTNSSYTNCHSFLDMSSEQSPVESVAVAFVVESSLAVAQEWRQVLLEYVQQLLKRLADTHPNFKVGLLYV
jgi:hypothetical protein